MQNDNDIYGQGPEQPNFLRRNGLRIILLLAVVYGIIVIFGDDEEEQRVGQVSQNPQEQLIEDLRSHVMELETRIERLTQAAHTHQQ